MSKPANQPGDFAPARILVVDDDADIRLLLRLELAAQDWVGEIREATDGRETLDIVGGGYVPDCVLTGLMMPNVTGWESITQLRASGYGGGIVVCASVVGVKGVDMSGIAGLVDSMLPKPFAPDDLVDAVWDSVRQHR